MQIDAVAFHFRSQSHRSRVASATTWQNPAIAHQLVAERWLLSLVETSYKQGANCL